MSNPWHTGGRAPLHLTKTRKPRDTKRKAEHAKPVTSGRERLERDLAEQLQELEAKR